MASRFIPTVERESIDLVWVHHSVLIDIHILTLASSVTGMLQVRSSLRVSDRSSDT